MYITITAHNLIATVTTEHEHPTSTVTTALAHPTTVMTTDYNDPTTAVTTASDKSTTVVTTVRDDPTTAGVDDPNTTVAVVPGDDASTQAAAAYSDPPTTMTAVHDTPTATAASGAQTSGLTSSISSSTPVSPRPCEIPTWLDITITRTARDAYTTRIMYMCKSDCYFEDEHTIKEATCSHGVSAAWSPSVEDCIRKFRLNITYGVTILHLTYM